MKKITDYKEKDWNVPKIKEMKFDGFKKMVLGWAEPTKIKDGATIPPTILKPTDAQIKSVYESLTGEKADKVEPKKDK